MSAVGDARKRLAEQTPATPVTPAAVAGLPGYYVDLDAYNTPTIWQESSTFPYGVPIAAVTRDTFRGHPKLWAAIVALIEGA